MTLDTIIKAALADLLWGNIILQNEVDTLKLLRAKEAETKTEKPQIAPESVG